MGIRTLPDTRSIDLHQQNGPFAEFEFC